MTRYAITRTDGGVSVMNLAENVTDANAEIAKWSPEQQAQVSSITACETYPEERTFREAWVYSPPATAVVVDMTKAKDVWRDKMRVARKPLLDELDRQWMRATGRGDTDEAQTIEDAREKLRNVTAAPQIEAATTPDQLKKVWPKVLGPRP